MRDSILLKCLLVFGASTCATPMATAKGAADPILVAIEKAMQKNGPEVHRCFEKALADRLDVTGRVEVEVQVGKGGKVIAAKAKKAERMIPPVLRLCVEKAALGFVLEGVDSGSTVVLPFAFKRQSKQYVVKAADVTDRSSKKGGSGRPRRTSSFTAKVLADATNVKTEALSLTLLSVGPASRVAMHRHPSSTKVLYLLAGRARLLGPKGVAPIRVDEGTAVFIPMGFPHVIENMGRQSTAVFLQAFAPPGPERVYRDPTDPVGRSAFEVIRDSRRAVLPPASHGVLLAVDPASVSATALGSSRGTVKKLLEANTTRSDALTLSVIELSDGGTYAGKGNAASDACHYLVSGRGRLKVSGESFAVESDSVFCLPVATGFSFKAAGDSQNQKVVLVEFAAKLKSAGNER